MRFLITQVTGRTGRSVARALLGAGHRVTGIGDSATRLLDPRVDLHPGRPDDPRALAAAAGAEPVEAVLHLATTGDVLPPTAVDGTRVVVLLPDEPSQADTLATAWATHPHALLVRPAPYAGRGVGPAEMRTLAGLFAAAPGSAWRLVHPDDVERYLVGELTTGSATGTVALAADGTVTAGDAVRRLRAAGVRKAPHAVVALPVPRPAENPPDFRPGWTAGEALTDLLRGLVDRTPAAGGARDRMGAITLPVDVIPARLPARDGGALVSAAPAGLQGEFDDLLDPRFPVYSATNTSEALPGPLTPLSIDLHVSGLRRANAIMAWMMALEGTVADEWNSRVNAVHGHHVFLNASISVLTAANLPGWSEESMREQAFSAIPDELVLHPRGRPKAAGGPAAIRAQATVVARLGAIARRFRTSAETINQAARTEAITAEEAARLDDAQLHARILLARDRLHQAWAGAGLGVIMVGAATNVHEQVSRTTGGPEIDLEKLESARTVLAVDRLAAILRADPELRALAEDGKVAEARDRSPRLAAALDTELEHIGHRGPGECEVANAVFADRPGLLLSAAANAADGPPRVRATATPSDLKGIPARTARLAAGATIARERARDGVVRINHRLRILIRERGTRLVAAGVLAESDDVFHLTLDEILAVPADATERVTRRRSERLRLKDVRMPDVFSGTWEPVRSGAVLAVDESITGLGVCPGVAQGPVRILTDPDDDIEPGDVLVASVTDVGHTSMFGYAAAVVTDIGGSASHAAIVAREYGVPCVVDTKLATARLTDGQIVRVDGKAGTVTVVAAG